jgi:hypothetical protein
MFERAHIGFSARRSPVPTVVLGAIGDAHPRCSATLTRGGRRARQAPATGTHGPLSAGPEAYREQTSTGVGMPVSPEPRA